MLHVSTIATAFVLAVVAAPAAQAQENLQSKAGYVSALPEACPSQKTAAMTKMAQAKMAIDPTPRC